LSVCICRVEVYNDDQNDERAEKRRRGKEKRENMSGSSVSSGSEEPQHTAMAEEIIEESTKSSEQVFLESVIRSFNTNIVIRTSQVIILS